MNQISLLSVLVRGCFLVCWVRGVVPPAACFTYFVHVRSCRCSRLGPSPRPSLLRLRAMQRSLQASQSTMTCESTACLPARSLLAHVVPHAGLPDLMRLDCISHWLVRMLPARRPPGAHLALTSHFSAHPAAGSTFRTPTSSCPGSVGRGGEHKHARTVPPRQRLARLGSGRTHAWRPVPARCMQQYGGRRRGWPSVCAMCAVD